MAKAKIAKKEWYPILAPNMFRNVLLGETFVYGPEQVMGKSLSQNLMALTNDVKKQGINVSFEVVSVEKNTAYTDITGYKMVTSSIRRLVRRNIGKIDMSFACTTSDGKNLRLKPLIITRMDVVSSIATKIRKNAQDYLVKHVSNSTYENFANDLVSHKLQEDLKKVLSKIYPLRICEIRSMEVVAEKKLQESAKKAPKAHKAEEQKVAVEAAA